MRAFFRFIRWPYVHIAHAVTLDHLVFDADASFTDVSFVPASGTVSIHNTVP
eukprot:m.510931 g.510931  ORF g.510931 m.510931 type:complete len:52 (-) comp57423_c1_seq2:372-527(-)